MKINLARILLVTNLLLIALVALLDVFMTAQHQMRYIAIYIQGLILGISALYMIISFTTDTIKLTGFHYFMLLFICLLSISGIISPVRDRLPALLYSVVPFYIFYYTAFKGYFQIMMIERFAIILLIIYAFDTYVGITARSVNLDEFYMKADNAGNRLMFLILIFSLDLRKSQNIVLLLVTYSLVLISFKRGAMLAATMALIIILWQLIFNVKTIWHKSRKKLVYFAIASVIILIFLMIIYWDVLIFRFVGDTGGGSGRMRMWQAILDSWKEGGMLKQILGFGFFKVQDLMTEIRGVPYFAHSDWIQLLYDHGLLGIWVYSLLFVFYISERKTVSIFAPGMYAAYIASLSIWILKSAWSGVYLTKHSVLLFIIAGFILGIAHRKQNIYIHAIRKKAL